MPKHEEAKPIHSRGIWPVLGKFVAEISFLHERLEEANYRADHDPLTGLLRVEKFKQIVQEKIDAKQPFGIILSDMDNFKQINDKIDHETGNDVLSRYGPFMLEKYHREGDNIAHKSLVTAQDIHSHRPTIGRYGGDEFLHLVDFSDFDQRASDPDKKMKKALTYCRSVNDEFVDSLGPGFKALGFGVSIGGAVWQPGVSSGDAGDIFRKADAAMYVDKHKDELGNPLGRRS